jgi:hypothetical protein
VNYGYDEGVRSGIADRRDRWAFNYRDSFAYQDANFAVYKRGQILTSFAFIVLAENTSTF